MSKSRLWTGRIVSAFAVLFLLMDGVMKLLRPASVVETFSQLGFPPDRAIGIGILELFCVIVYVIPQVSVLGAILLTGYLGGAIATHVRVESPLFTHTLFPVYVAALIWVGLLLRRPWLGTMLLLRTRNPAYPEKAHDAKTVSAVSPNPG